MSIALAFTMIAVQAGVAAQGPLPEVASLTSEYGSGVCRIIIVGKDSDGESIDVEFSRRLRDGNLGISLKGSFIQKFRGKSVEDNHPVTVNFDNGESAPSRSGGYDLGGFREYVWGGWGAGAVSDATYGQLKDVTSFSVEMDGNSFGPFVMPEKGAAYQMLDQCEIDNS